MCIDLSGPLRRSAQCNLQDSQLNPTCTRVSVYPGHMSDVVVRRGEMRTSRNKKPELGLDWDPSPHRQQGFLVTIESPQPSVTQDAIP